MKCPQLETAKQNNDKFYFTGKPCKYGHLSKRCTYNRECVECRYILTRSEKKRIEKQKYYRLNRESIKQRVKNYEQVTKYTALWRQRNQEHVRQYRKCYMQANLPHIKAKNTQRKAIKLQRLPEWADIECIKEIYANCPKGYHVDHIVPLLGEIVCGLHVEYNLQYLLAEENISKGNRFPHEKYHLND